MNLLQDKTEEQNKIENIAVLQKSAISIILDRIYHLTSDVNKLQARVIMLEQTCLALTGNPDMIAIKKKPGNIADIRAQRSAAYQEFLKTPVGQSWTYTTPDNDQPKPFYMYIQGRCKKDGITIRSIMNGKIITFVRMS